MSPSRHRAPRVGVGIAAATLLVVLAAALSPLVPSVAAMIPWPSLGAFLDPGGTPLRAVLPPAPDPTPAPGAPDPTGTPTDGGLLYPVSAAGADPDGSVAYALLPIGPLDPLVLAPPGSPHLTGSLISDGCGSCHRGHTAQDPTLLTGATTQASLCFSCHGPGSTPDVQAAFTEVSANNPAISSYYAHPAAADTAHAPGIPDEFSGRLERHASCVDCHDPHNANGTLAVAASPGSAWSASGAIVGASGVRVFNGVAGSAPVYALVRNVAFEYQLCFKCHSGWTQLPAQDGLRPSTWALDKGVEFNPLNGSFHPIEAAGWNATPAMALSLAGGSLWQFTVGSTIRCVNCHGDPSKAEPGDTTSPDERLAPHASAERGLLIAPYRDRLLKPSGVGYAGADFTLCYLCHAQAPFVSTGSGATNFELHATHMVGIDGKGSGGLDIDVAGAGQGNAICAECHFRLHSTALAVKPGDVNNARLVNFAPNVVSNGSLRWSGAGGTCTLTCHGVPHRDAGYALAAVQNAALGVDARISIAASGTVQVGGSRTFTVTVEKNDGTGGGWAPAAGVTVTVLPSGVGLVDDAASTCDDQVTDGSGQCLIVITSPDPGQTMVDASATVAVEGVVGLVNISVATGGTNGPGATVSKVATWVAARISIGTSDTKLVGESIAFTVTLEKNLGLGGGWIPAGGITVAGTELGDGSIDLTAGTCDDQPTDSGGQCTIVVTSLVAGASTADASATVAIGGLSISVLTNGYGAFVVSNTATWVDPPPP